MFVCVCLCVDLCHCPISCLSICIFSFPCFQQTAELRAIIRRVVSCWIFMRCCRKHPIPTTHRPCICRRHRRSHLCTVHIGQPGRIYLHKRPWCAAANSRFHDLPYDRFVFVDGIIAFWWLDTNTATATLTRTHAHTIQRHYTMQYHTRTTVIAAPGHPAW